MTGNRPYHNDSPQSARRAVTENDWRVRKGGTYHEFAASEAGAIGGRFAAESKQRVVGSASFKYPALPANSPWASDPVPAEEPLGVDLNAAPVVGEAHEVEQSLQALGEANSSGAGRLLPADAGRALPGGAQALRGGLAPTHVLRPRRRSSKRSKG